MSPWTQLCGTLAIVASAVWQPCTHSSAIGYTHIGKGTAPNTRSTHGYSPTCLMVPGTTQTPACSHCRHAAQPTPAAARASCCSPCANAPGPANVQLVTARKPATVGGTGCSRTRLPGSTLAAQLRAAQRLNGRLSAPTTSTTTTTTTASCTTTQPSAPAPASWRHAQFHFHAVWGR